MKDQNDNKAVDWVEILAKRQAYNYGIRTPETREACRIYMADLRKRKKEAQAAGVQG